MGPGRLSRARAHSESTQHHVAEAGRRSVPSRWALASPAEWALCPQIPHPSLPPGCDGGRGAGRLPRRGAGSFPGAGPGCAWGGERSSRTPTCPEEGSWCPFSIGHRAPALLSLLVLSGQTVATGRGQGGSRPRGQGWQVQTPPGSTRPHVSGRGWVGMAGAQEAGAGRSRELGVPRREGPSASPSRALNCNRKMFLIIFLG